MLKIALTKGRTEKQVIPLLEKSGVDCSGLLNKKRRLIVSVADKYQFVLAKGPDVMTYLTNGACDIGIVGSDILEEQGRTENQLLDLNVGKCRFILASTSSFDPKKERRKVIGTKYPNITQRYFESIGEDVEIVKIEGSVELAPLVGLADAIVDLTERRSRKIIWKSMRNLERFQSGSWPIRFRLSKRSMKFLSWLMRWKTFAGGFE